MPVLGIREGEGSHALSKYARKDFMYRGVFYSSVERAYLERQARHFRFTELALILASEPGLYRAADRKNQKHVRFWTSWSNKVFGDLPATDPRVRAWKTKKDQVMFGIVLAKCRSDANAARVLLATGSQFLVDVDTPDPHWSSISNKDDSELARLIDEGGLVGDNRLGLILMAVRNALRRGNHPLTRLRNRTRKYLANRKPPTRKLRPCEPPRKTPRTEVQIIQGGNKHVVPTNGAVPMRRARRLQTGKQAQAQH
jgi:predicted NAD-dependent protein-ADP-ribosyltransferase YbiA (DUF1768 family)